MSRDFPGGICDGEGKSAYLLPATGELVAVDLADGAVRWRRPGAGRPVAASASHLLTLSEEAGESRLVLLDAETGRDVAELRPEDVPGFGRVSPGDALAAEIAETEDGPRIRWSSESRYRGGAAPPKSLAPGRPGGGAFLVDARTGKVRPLPAETGPRTLRGLRSPAGASAGEEEGDAGDSRLTLRQEEGQLTLEARGGDGSLLWETRLGKAPPSRPKALRP